MRSRILSVALCLGILSSLVASPCDPGSQTSIGGLAREGKSAVATLVGYDEYVPDPLPQNYVANPRPRKYRVKTLSGELKTSLFYDSAGQNPLVDSDLPPPGSASGTGTRIYNGSEVDCAWTLSWWFTHGSDGKYVFNYTGSDCQGKNTLSGNVIFPNGFTTPQAAIASGSANAPGTQYVMIGFHGTGAAVLKAGAGNTTIHGGDAELIAAPYYNRMLIRSNLIPLHEDVTYGGNSTKSPTINAQGEVVAVETNAGTANGEVCTPPPDLSPLSVGGLASVDDAVSRFGSVHFAGCTNSNPPYLPEDAPNHSPPTHTLNFDSGIHQIGTSGVYRRVDSCTLKDTLIDEDTEDEAIGRAVLAVDTTRPPSAFYEQRSTSDTDGNPFTFHFGEMTASATFELCPGDYKVTVRYSRRPFRSNDAWEENALPPTEHFLVVTKGGPQFFTHTLARPAAPSLYEYTIASFEVTSTSCSAPGGEIIYKISSVHTQMTLGPLDTFHGAGVLVLDKSDINAEIYTPVALNYVGPVATGVDVVRDGSGTLRQVNVPTVLANIVDRAPSIEGYDVEFYNHDQIGTKDPLTGLYGLTGAPFVTYRFENPAASLPSLQVTETREGSANSKVIIYTQDAANGLWSLDEGDGLRVTEVVTTADGNGDKVETRTLKTATGAAASVIATIYHPFDWGVEKIKEVLDPAEAALTTAWDYYSTSASVDGASNYRRLKQRTDANGYWEIYTYGSDGRVATIKAPHLDAAPNAPDSQCRITEIDRTPLSYADGDSVAEPMTRTTVTLLGQEISRSYEIEWTDPVTLGGDVCERVTTVRCAVPGADWNALTSLQTETLRYASGDFKGRLRREIRPDGTCTLVTYALNTGNGQLTTTTLEGQPNGTHTDIVAGQRTVTVTNAQGYLVSEDTYRIESTPADMPIASTDALLPDAFGRPTRFEYLDGTYETRTYACCGLKEERDREGTVTVHDYDDLGRHTHTTRAGITLKTSYDAAGRVRATQRYPEGSPTAAITISATDYDLAGRVTATRDAAGRQTDIEETLSPSTRRTTTVTTLPGPLGERGTITEIHAADGQLLKRTGNATTAVSYDYGTAVLTDASSWGYGGTQYFTTTVETKLDSAGVATDEVVTTYADALGRTIKTLYADDAAVRSFYNNKGQLVRQADPDGVQTLQEYNALGESVRTILDLNRDGLVTEVEPTPGAGADRITQATRSYLTRTDSGITTDIVRTVTEVWADDTSNLPTTVSTVDRSVDGLKSWSTAYGLTTRSVTTYGPTNGLRTETVTLPDNSTQVTVYQDGRLQSVTRRDSANVQISAVSYDYDDYGRTETVTDARTGTTSYAYYPDSDDLLSVTTPDPDTTRSGSGYDAQTTIYHYDDAGRVDLVTLPDHTVQAPSQTHTTYWPGGQVKRTWGSRTYPSEYTYDAQGRVKTLTTWQDFAGSTDAAITTWDYDPERGWLSGKRYQDNTGPAYTYWPSGRLKTRDWVRTVSPSGPRLRTTYTYNDAGDLWTVNYNDIGTAHPTPPVTQTYDRLGRALGTTDAAGLLTRSYQNGRLDDEVYSSTGLLSGQSVSREQDGLQRLQTLQVGASSLGVANIGYTYDNASRLQTVTRGTTHTATYGYLANSSLIETVTLKEGSATRLTATRVYDKLNRLVSLTNVGASATRSAAYEFDGANQRQRLTREDDAYWDFDYDPLGQVTGATKHRADDAALPGHAFAFDYDDIGNRKTATTNARTSTYLPNLLNQYEQRTVPGAIDVSGEAQAGATVTVNNQPTQRLGDLFHGTATADNSAAPQYVTATVVGVKNNVGSNGEDAVTEVTRQAFLAKTPEMFSYDADGNLTADGRWNYEWDAENRLTAMETLPAVAAPTGPLPSGERRRLEFAYDAIGRRIQKIVKTWDGSAYATASDTRFLYDGWNLVAELGWDSSTSTFSLNSSHIWGLDLSGSPQGAGGVGGLLLSASSAGVYAPTYDGNGNVLALYNAATGAIAADYEYGPFGEVLKSDGVAAVASPFGFSTKYRDIESGLNYYGFRYYNPSVGCWLSRDPIEEQGGLNLYGMVRNDTVNKSDKLGLAPSTTWTTKIGGADAYGLVPWSLSGGYTWPIGIGFTVGSTIEVVYNCRDGSAEAFATVSVGPNFGSPGAGLTYGKGLNFIYNLATATDYSGWFVAVTGSYVSPTPALGGYGTGFTTPAGLGNLITTGGFGGQTYGFGFGWSAGIPGLGISGTVQYFWDLGSVPFSASMRSRVCSCVTTGGGPMATTSDENVIRELRQEAASSTQSLHSAIKSRISTDTILGGLPSGLGVGNKVNQISWRRE